MQHIWTSFDKININVNKVQLKSMHESENIQDIFINTLHFSQEKIHRYEKRFLPEMYNGKC